MNTSALGWIGLGKMGNPMAKRLLNAGYPLAVYNRDTTKTDEFIELGAKRAVSPSSLIDEVTIVFVMVSDDKAIDDLFKGANGLLTSAATDKIIVNMSTVSPAISKEMARLCREKGNYYLDAPVSGSVKQAEDGQLVIMVGGDEATYRKTEALLSILGKMSLRVGDTGAGNTAKLAINTLLAVQAQGLAETMVFAENNGIQKTDLISLIHNSALGNIFMKIKGDAVINQNYTAVFALKHIAKDLRLAKAEGIASPLADTVYQSFQDAEPSLGSEDIIAIIKTI
ncbi:NAD(P)-dependent oxidoreductase [Pedobacter sp. Du54]|uniref:NAD(P)-dependent oxidoreductase n=1 Tax=Pedobacter anseongensis TaxID=3133439 RepID=UPI0030AC8DFF